MTDKARLETRLDALIETSPNDIDAIAHTQMLIELANIGDEPETVCGRVDGEGNLCQGILEPYNEDCYCSAAAARGHAPCSVCEKGELVCETCGWTSGDDTYNVLDRWTKIWHDLLKGA